MPSQNTPVTVTFVLDQERVRSLGSAFPEKDNIQEVANALAAIMMNELVDLLAGRKRYLSLSHQYIEWMEQIYACVLPGEEYTFSRLYNQFNFPPGSAAYVARVLRDRQTTVLRDRASKGLRQKLEKQLKEYDALKPEDKPTAKMRSISFTPREHGLLTQIIDDLIARDLAIEYPRKTHVSPQIVTVSFSVDNIKQAMAEITKA